MTAHDPYAPVSRVTQQRPTHTLPVGRLRRLGATARVIVTLGAVWGEMDDQEKAETSAFLASVPDAELAGVLDRLEVPDAGANAVIEWVENHDDQATAARLAMAAERLRDKPRTSLLAKLEKY